jgi:hypothetical protein
VFIEEEAPGLAAPPVGLFFLFFFFLLLFVFLPLLLETTEPNKEDANAVSYVASLVGNNVGCAFVKARTYRPACKTTFCLLPDFLHFVLLTALNRW